MKLNYLLIGAGGTGGILGSSLTKAGKNVTLIARGANLHAMQEHGLTIRHLWNQTEENIPVHAVSMEEYESQKQAPDVIFVCVKGYSIDSVLPFIKKVADPHTIVIPILNIYGTGAHMQKELPDSTVLDGCIYVSAALEQPGTLVQHGPILRVVFGPRDPAQISPVMQTIQADLCESGAEGILSRHIQRDALEKFSYVSPIGAAGVYLHAVAGDFQKEGRARELFKSMIREITNLAAAMGYPFEKDYVAVNLEILSHLSADATTSMQRDIQEGKPSEIDGLVMEVVRLGQSYSVSMPYYKEVARALCPSEF